MAPDPDPPDLVSVVRILRPWGRQGQLKVEAICDLPQHLAPQGRLFLQGAPVMVESVNHHQKGLILKLTGVDSAEAAATLRGKVLQIPGAELPPLPEGSYYQFQLLGLRVLTTEGRLLGQVIEVLATGANDVYVVRGEGGQVLIPAVDEVVKSVDLEAGEIVVEPLEGLLEEKASP